MLFLFSAWALWIWICCKFNIPDGAANIGFYALYFISILTLLFYLSSKATVQ